MIGSKRVSLFWASELVTEALPTTELKTPVFLSTPEFSTEMVFSSSMSYLALPHFKFLSNQELKRSISYHSPTY